MKYTKHLIEKVEVCAITLVLFFLPDFRKLCVDNFYCLTSKTLAS